MAKRKNSLRPVETESVLEIPGTNTTNAPAEQNNAEVVEKKLTVDNLFNDDNSSENQCTDDSVDDNVMDEIKRNVNENISIKTTENDEMLKNMKDVIEDLKSKNQSLTEELEEIKKSMDKITEENDDLILKNSDLQYDNVTKDNTINVLRKEIDSLNATIKHLNDHVMQNPPHNAYSKEAYDNVPQARTIHHPVIYNSNNGYQSWN